MGDALLWVVLGLGGLYLGAEGLVRGSAALALRLGVSPLVIGLTIVAWGTSSPEIVVSVQAALRGSADVAVGNVVGSNICNIALILGLASVLQPLRVQARLLRLDVPLLIGVSLLSGGLLWDGRLGWQGGVLLLGLLGCYTGLNFYLSRKESPELLQEGTATLPHPLRHPWIEGAIVVLGLGLLVVGGHWFLEGAVTLARWLGLSEAFIGLSVVAVGTSLPELATSVVAALRREADIAVGNVVGSNLFNLLAILGLSAVVRPLQTTDVQHLDLLVMNALTWVLLPLMWSGHRIHRGEGLLLLGLYGAYLLGRAAL
ncbi:Na+/Ca+ antiporter, CaCA family [Rhodothermus marinus SG0.5JP17-172]|uniref:calcium/sodium antiporter n=1 Tax=Rhodothermus marinus TaxID=29549 RepID=UPI000223DAC9|nr:calcium/sodium antiporter [Rhodothermus marinus]AEN72542.1 Na+/Ca+ antiporter, CaCA family [Rhodothermus marinus SG0.5JP17-172]